jgi:hypothetical protein
MRIAPLDKVVTSELLDGKNETMLKRNAYRGVSIIAAMKTLALKVGYAMREAENVENLYATREGHVKTVDTNVWTFTVYQKHVTIGTIRWDIAWKRKGGMDAV